MIQRIKLCGGVFDINQILEADSLANLNKLEKSISLELLKNSLFKKNNEKKLPLSKEIVQKIIISKSD